MANPYQPLNAAPPPAYAPAPSAPPPSGAPPPFAPSAPPPSAPMPSAPSAPVEDTRFDDLVVQHELRPEVASQLRQVLTSCDVVLLCDDSSSMNQPIAEEGTDPFAVKRSTRWGELKKLASVIIRFVTAINPNGLDLYFFNRPTLRQVTSTDGLTIFANPPKGATPLCTTLRRIFDERSNVAAGRQLLVVCITDGEPSDGNRDDLFRVLTNKRDNVHVSFAECTDNADDMEYLDAWDGVIRNFDNTDDYREELARVRAVQGPRFKFDYTDYVIKILLATFVRWYFNLDQQRVQPNTGGGWIQGSGAPQGYNQQWNGGYQSGTPGYPAQGGYYGGGYQQGGYPQQYQQQQSSNSCCTIL